jgi:hypothetical protein
MSAAGRDFAPKKHEHLFSTCRCGKVKFVLLRELPRSRAAARAVGLRASRARSGRWNQRREYLEEHRLKPEGIATNPHAQSMASIFRPLRDARLSPCGSRLLALRRLGCPLPRYSWGEIPRRGIGALYVSSSD